MYFFRDSTCSQGTSSSPTLFFIHEIPYYIIARKCFAHFYTWKGRRLNFEDVRLHRVGLTVAYRLQSALNGGRSSQFVGDEECIQECHVEDVGHAFNKKKVKWNFNSVDMDAPSYSIGLTQDEPIAGEVQEAEEDSNKNKGEGTLDIVDFGGPSYSSGLKVDEQEFGNKKDEGDIKKKEELNKRPAFSMLNAFVKLGYHSKRNKEVQKIGITKSY
ncbi:hypothetical protein L1987_23579 [Smallanthus sonchifolius]|uniref:Uncharacterized protein n=1 Tax=Smallanthus sonchifolius TaxID=185202 RepID=A0ACB9IJI2_9ASTR|nr:hypothetical protein L1987_23579 [Smallanthus sonchifolius]